MKKIFFIILVLLSINVFSQQNDDYKNFIQQIKKDTKIDKDDNTIYNLLNDFYEQALQSDEGELKPDIPLKIQKLYEDKNTKNIHILIMLLTYQEHISETAAVGKKPDSEFQVNLMTDLENEMKAIYDKIPPIIYIYKAEALSSNGQKNNASIIVSKGLVEYPNSIPLKVYKYIETNDEKIKNDLIQNHSNHWMIKQFGIK
ncbi:MAG: hypothetical protein KF781_06220 [Chitinophagaceae bacterium]|nr:hypothetical protein [Chitinophagaceae bacterium]MCW5904178.1 hypothetical protein [Chitinophagaceae bacterium]